MGRYEANDRARAAGIPGRPARGGALPGQRRDPRHRPRGPAQVAPAPSLSPVRGRGQGEGAGNAKRALLVHHRIAPHGGHADLDERMRLRRVAGGATRTQGLDALLEQREVLRLDRFQHLRVGPLEQERVRVLPELRPPLEPGGQRAAERTPVAGDRRTRDDGEPVPGRRGGGGR